MHLGKSQIVRLTVTIAMVLVFAFAGGATRTYASISSSSGFEGGDGNLTVDATGNTDWNSFTANWTGTAPYRQATATAVNGWQFGAAEDATKSSSVGDTGFAGGTKQDADCASVINTTSPNKDDLKRIYLASKTDPTTGHTYLALAWERIPLNTTSSSAHVGFEFNQGTTPCGSGSDGLVKRTAGDLLFVYDFAGSGAGSPTLTVRKWVTTPGTPCDIGSDSPPCWGVAQSLSSAGFADAAVDDGSSVGGKYPTKDLNCPPSGNGDPCSSAAAGPAGQNPACTGGNTGGNGSNGVDCLGQSEFGETVADLTGAGVFPAGVCESFGQSEAVSRSSGNSGNAAMEDLVGPLPFHLTNCGEVIITKHTDPRGVSQNFGYTSTVTGNLKGTTTACPSSFNLNDGSSSTNTQDCINVPVGSYTVSENSEPNGFLFESLNCSASGTGTSVTPNGSSTSNETASITMSGGGLVTCTYTNQKFVTPTVTTALSANPVDVGTSVHDSATLSGAQGTAGGTITFFYSTNSDCSSATQVGSPVSVSGNGTYNSSSVQLSTAGTYYWQAFYSGDTATGNNPAHSVCGTENLVVKAVPAIVTQLSSGSVSIGQSVSDTATLSNASTSAGGTITFYYSTQPDCTTGKTQVGSAVSVSGNGNYNSSSITFPHAGTFYWFAVYSGDTFNESATSACGAEQLVVQPNQSAIKTAPNLLPNDAATLSNLAGTAGGTVTFSLYAPGDTTCTQAPVYTSGPIAVNGNGTYQTSNTSTTVSTLGTYQWQVTYSGDGDNLGSTSSCGVEQFTLANSNP